MKAHPGVRGFTLVELLVALFVLSLVAILSWRGLDGMVRTQSALQGRADDVLALQAGVAQWRTDLDAVTPLPGLPAVAWNGQVLRMVRQVEGPEGPAMAVVAWTRRNDAGASLWRRWLSPPATTRQAIEAAWQQADLWARNPGAAERLREAAVAALDDWQVFFYRGDAWVNPQTSDAQRAGAEGSPPAPAANTTLPEGVRVVLSLPAGGPVSGDLTLDWVNSRVSGGRR